MNITIDTATLDEVKFYIDYILKIDEYQIDLKEHGYKLLMEMMKASIDKGLTKKELDGMAPEELFFLNMAAMSIIGLQLSK